MLTDLVSLVRFALTTSAGAVSRAVGGAVRALARAAGEPGCASRRSSGSGSMIRDHIAASLEITMDDLDYAPFDSPAGGTAYGSSARLGPLLDELNEVLAA